jgi:RNA polymerase sigma factor (sigma-70 family)
MVRMGGTSGVSELVRASAGGDQAAWNELVRRYARLVMAVISSYRLTAADAQDVSQTVWLRLVEHLGSLREPEALPRWLKTTTQRECGRYVQRGRRTVPVDPQSDTVVQQPASEDIGSDIVRAELRQALRDGLAELAPRDQSLLRLFAAATSYKEISELLGMRPGSVGPTLRRCLDRLRETKALRAYLGSGLDAGGRVVGGDRLELAPVD